MFNQETIQISSVKNLTDKQKDIFYYIAKYKIKHQGNSPTFRKIASEFNVHVKAIYDTCNALKKKGYITWSGQNGFEIYHFPDGRILI